MAVDRTAYRHLFGLDVVDEHRVVWTAFEELGWVSVASDKVTVHGDGVFYLPLLQNALAYDRNEQMRRKPPPVSITVPTSPSPALVAGPARV